MTNHPNRKYCIFTGEFREDRTKIDRCACCRSIKKEGKCQNPECVECGNYENE